MMALTSLSSDAVRVSPPPGLEQSLDSEPMRIDVRSAFPAPPGLELPSAAVLSAVDDRMSQAFAVPASFELDGLQQRNAELRLQQQMLQQMLQQSAAASLAAAALRDMPMGTGTSRSSRRRRARRVQKLQGFMVPFQAPLAMATFDGIINETEVVDLCSDCDGPGSDDSTSQGSSQDRDVCSFGELSEQEEC
jgi:hypothetical protein